MIELEILKNICLTHGVSPFELLGNSRRQKVVNARIDACSRLKQFGYSPREIGILLGNRDRTTILNLLKKSAKNLSPA